MKYALTLAGLWLAGCANTEAVVLFGPRWDGQQTEFAAQLTVTQQLKGRRVCSYSHNSEPFHGEPFSGNDTLHTDFAGCGIRWSK